MTGQRQPVVDALKVVAAQAIVLHHLASYGPVGDAVAQALPELVDWFYDYGRMVVQVFLVLGGYLAAQPLLGAMRGPAPVLARALGLRYLRLVPPFVMATALAVLAAQWSMPWLSGTLLEPAPRTGQLLAHLFLLHSVLDVGALTAGAWYVAMDFQLYGLLALLLWLGQRGGQQRWAMGLVLGTTAASLLWWNTQTELDDWALYFFGAYGLGAVARLAQAAPAAPPSGAALAGTGQVWQLGLVLLAGLALLLDFRTRIALALAVALLLVISRGQLPGLPTRATWWLAWLGQRSYALFLVHFPVLLLGNAWWARSESSGPVWGCAFVLGIWGASLLLAWAFERWVEAPLGRRLPRLARPIAQA